jgi:hypothetical protein
MFILLGERLFYLCCLGECMADILFYRNSNPGYISLFSCLGIRLFCEPRLDRPVFVNSAFNKFLDIAIALDKYLPFMAGQLEISSAFGVKSKPNLANDSCIAIFNHLETPEVRHIFPIFLEDNHVIRLLGNLGASKDAACIQLGVVVNLINSLLNIE